MKGIILAGGKAKRLYPITRGTCKQLLPVYDKPMIYYPLSVLMLAGIRDILVISNPLDLPRFKNLLGSGEEIGVRISYAVQPQPQGIAQSFIIAEDFIGKDTVCLILGDNIFYGHNLTQFLKKGSSLKSGALILGYYINNPQGYGVLELGKDNKVLAIKEKPRKTKSTWAVPGLYFYDNKVAGIAKGLRPSARGELEITDINKHYLKKGKLKVELMGRGYAWLDTGTPESLIAASIFIKTIEERQSLKIGCIEEVAFRCGYITREQLKKLAEKTNTSYGGYLERIYEEGL